VTPEEFIAYFPEFADVPKPQIVAALARSAVWIDPTDTSRWAASTALLNEGTANLVAHLIVTSPAAGKAPFRDAGDIVAEDRPTLKITRDSKRLQAIANDPFSGSQYGVQYVYLRDYIVGKGAFVPSCPPTTFAIGIID
jgi:Protein of unknown function (DUF4054)